MKCFYFLLMLVIFSLTRSERKYKNYQFIKRIFLQFFIIVLTRDRFVYFGWHAFSALSVFSPQTEQGGFQARVPTGMHKVERRQRRDLRQERNLPMLDIVAFQD